MEEQTEQPITDAELDEWQALTDAAAGGPWVAGDYYDWDVKQALNPWQTIALLTACYPEGGIGLEEGDARFIAASRSAVPRLIAEVRRLKEQLRSWEDTSLEQHLFG